MVLHARDLKFEVFCWPHKSLKFERLRYVFVLHAFFEEEVQEMSSLNKNQCFTLALHYFRWEGRNVKTAVSFGEGQAKLIKQIEASLAIYVSQRITPLDGINMIVLNSLLDQYWLQNFDIYFPVILRLVCSLVIQHARLACYGCLWSVRLTCAGRSRVRIIVLLITKRKLLRSCYI